MEHKLRTLVRTDHCKIDHCQCGAVHISVGNTTVRVQTNNARELRDALVRAMAEIDAPNTTTATVRPRVGGPFRIVLPDDPEQDDGDDPQFH
ncbi:MAG: hypothetical protein AAF799_13720 [Myxococcota bacterium]